MDKDKLPNEILRVLKEMSHPIQMQDLQTALPEFRELPAEAWNSILNDLMSDSLIDAKVVRSGIFGTIGAVFNIEITKRGRMLTPDAKNSVARASREAATVATTRDVISSSDDRNFAQLAIDEAVKSVAEDDRAHPRVGAVVVKDGKIMAQAHRGESPGSHAEYIALEKKLANEFISGATVYTTLEPLYSFRNDPKKL